MDRTSVTVDAARARASGLGFVMQPATSAYLKRHSVIWPLAVTARLLKTLPV